MHLKQETGNKPEEDEDDELEDVTETETDELLVLDALVEPGRLVVLVALVVSIRNFSSHQWDANSREEEELENELVAMLDEKLEELVWVAENR